MMRAAVALGSNLGDRAAHLRRGLAGIAATPTSRVVRVSSFYETAPEGPAQPDYLNAVAVVETNLDATGLLNDLLCIESGCGRVRGERNAPRTLDLDLLLWGEERIDRPGLTVPHPRMHLRAFVLVPLAEVALDWRHPVEGGTVRDLLDRLPDGEASRGIRPWRPAVAGEGA